MIRPAIMLLLRGYRAVVSPLYGQVCRYHPSCSAYALQAVDRHGAVVGSWLAVRRLARCHPWAVGGYDPVPGPEPGTDDTVQTGRERGALSATSGAPTPTRGS